MKAKVFISCGQRKDREDEIKFAKEIRNFIKQKGYEPILSSEMQTLQGVNECLIKEMKRADYYLFVDLKREEFKLTEEKCKRDRQKFRGSLYTHQELAWAYLLNLDNVIFLQQKAKGFESEELLAYWLHDTV